MMPTSRAIPSNLPKAPIGFVLQSILFCNCFCSEIIHSGFYHYRYSAYHKSNLICNASNVLVNPSLQIGEFSADLCFSMNAHSNLITDNKKGCMDFLQLVYFIFYSFQGVFYIILMQRKKVGQPKCYAINDYCFITY